MWKVSSFDQCGGEFGRVLLDVILTNLKEKTNNKHRVSTRGLIKIFKSNSNSYI
ncbi:MAG: hypothetical protein LBI98_02790 [Endomicrobium sp.]|jgi:glucose-6-phosphate isomerase|nr:hypothetical protein [Endomicrobium sp.]